METAFDALVDAPSEALLVAFSNGDRDAASVLAQRLTPIVLGYAMRLLDGDRAEAEDIAQEAMLRLWKQSGSWRQGEAKVTTWLYRVVSNLCIDRRRRARTVGIDEVPEQVDGTPGMETRMMQSVRERALSNALAKLPQRQKQAVILRHLEGLSNPEIAGIMETGVEAVESLTARGKRGLADQLASRREELGYADG